MGPNGRGFFTFSPQGIGNTVWSFARQAQITNDVVRSFGLDKVNIGTTGRLAMYETSCLDIGEDLIKTVFLKAADAAMNMGLDRFRSQGNLLLFHYQSFVKYVLICFRSRFIEYVLVSILSMSNHEAVEQYIHNKSLYFPGRIVLSDYYILDFSNKWNNN